MTSAAEVLRYVATTAAGGLITYALTWVRERRRTLDAYRAPQREAIGGIIAATHELLLRESDLREALTELINQGRGQPHRKVSDEQLAAASNGINAAFLGVDRAFNTGRLAIVDAVCYEKMGVAYNEFVRLKNAFGDWSENADNLARLTAEVQRYAVQLNRHVADLVLAAHQRVSPVQGLWNRGRRRAVSRRLQAKYFEQPDRPQPHY